MIAFVGNRLAIHSKFYILHTKFRILVLPLVIRPLAPLFSFLVTQTVLRCEGIYKRYHTTRQTLLFFDVIVSSSNILGSLQAANCPFASIYARAIHQTQDC